MGEAFTLDQMDRMYQYIAEGVTRERLNILYEFILKHNPNLMPVSQRPITHQERPESSRLSYPSSPPSSIAGKDSERTTIIFSDESRHVDRDSPPYQMENDQWIGASSSVRLTPPASDTSIDQPDDINLERFKRRGEKIIYEEIKRYVEDSRIKKSTIAEMTEISVGYISRYLNNEGQRLPEKIKDRIYQWYLEAKKSTKVAIPPPRTIPDGKRDRYDFSRVHQEILLRSFEKSHYPKNDEKEDLVDKCNEAFERYKGRPLKESEKVTVAIINNWFNNRRKFLKKCRGIKDPARNHNAQMAIEQPENSRVTMPPDPLPLHHDFTYQQNDSNSMTSDQNVLGPNFPINLNDIKIEPGTEDI